MACQTSGHDNDGLYSKTKDIVLVIAVDAQYRGDKNRASLFMMDVPLCPAQAVQWRFISLEGVQLPPLFGF